MFAFNFVIEEGAGEPRRSLPAPPPPPLPALPLPPLEVIRDLSSTAPVGALVSVPGFDGELQRVDGGESGDVVADKYEGGAKVWECTGDVLLALRRNRGLLPGHTVLDLGCGTGLLGVFAARLGARHVVFQDMNADVLRHVTARNVCANRGVEGYAHATFLGGRWESLLRAFEDGSVPRVDVILSSETLYRPAHYPTLVAIIQRALTPGGVAIFGTKRFYYGAELGGGSQLFITAAEATGLSVRTISVHEDGWSMTRDVLTISRCGEAEQGLASRVI